MMDRRTDGRTLATKCTTGRTRKGSAPAKRGCNRTRKAASVWSPLSCFISYAKPGWSRPMPIWERGSTRLTTGIRSVLSVQLMISF